MWVELTLLPTKGLVEATWSILPAVSTMVWSEVRCRYFRAVSRFRDDALVQGALSVNGWEVMSLAIAAL